MIIKKVLLLALLLADNVFSFNSQYTTSTKKIPAQIRTLVASAETETVPSSTEDEILRTEEEEEFLSRTKDLCKERNIPFSNIKNARDLASVPTSKILPNKVYRMGRVSDASSGDVDIMMKEMNITTLIDLRSPTELKEDPTLNNPGIFSYFSSFQWLGNKMKDVSNGIEFSRRKKIVSKLKRFYNRNNESFEDESIEKKEYCDDPSKTAGENPDVLEIEPLDIDSSSNSNRKRIFVSMMNEFKYVRGTLSKLRKRDIARVILKSPGAIVSKSVRESCYNVFINEINDGGLPMLNELLLKQGAPGIRFVLEVLAEKKNHPVAFYCTAGKDRTGIISAILLLLTGVVEEEIVTDYSLSANVYAEMDDHKAMVGALSQRNLDPKTFLGAPPQVMRDSLKGIEDNYGSLENYLDIIGFDKEKRQKLIEALTS